MQHLNLIFLNYPFLNPEGVAKVTIIIIIATTTIIIRAILTLAILTLLLLIAMIERRRSQAASLQTDYFGPLPFGLWYYSSIWFGI